MSTPWWTAAQHADRRPLLLARNRIQKAVRQWFEAQGFIEVETACLQVSPGNETHLHAFATDFISEAGARQPLYLHTSPEFACKKLLAAGETRIFTFAPCFRNGERGPLHSPEFTMLEWYRVGAPYEQLWADCADLAKLAADVTGRTQWSWRGRTCDVNSLHQRTTVQAAFAQIAQVLLAKTIGASGVPDLPAMRAVTTGIGVRVSNDDTWSDLFSRILGERIEPFLGHPLLEILYEYPSHEAALARRHPGKPEVAERFELYCCGIELANGFGELTDAAEQLRRFEAEMDEKARLYGHRYPIDDDFLAALAMMPPSAGCALGFDRLVMLATGAPHIDHVRWTPLAVTPKR